MSLFFKILILSLLFNLSCENEKFVKQGVVNQHSFFTNIEDSSKLPSAPNTESKIWFMDSCVIYEMKVIRTLTDHTDSGTFQTLSYDLFKFTYMDLRTLTCQDYYHFSDTASPVCNYAIKPGEPVNWNFYSKRPEIDTSGVKRVLTDTVLNNKTLKRLRFSHSADGYTDEIIYYIDCDAKQNIFHINPTIDEMFPDCKIVRSESRGDIKSHLTWVFEANMIRETLNSDEKAIFLKWAKNARDTKLPLITALDAMKRCSPDNSPHNTLIPNK